MWHTCKAHLALANFNLREVFLNSLCQRICSYYSSSIGIHLIKWQILKSSCFRLSSSPTDAHPHVARPESYAKMWQNALQLISRAMWHIQQTMQHNNSSGILASSSARPVGGTAAHHVLSTCSIWCMSKFIQYCDTHTHYIYVYIYYIDKYIAFIMRYERAPEKKRQNFCLQLPENTRRKNRKVVIF